MFLSTARGEYPVSHTLRPLSLINTTLKVQPLTEEQRAETLAFLAARPVHNVFVRGLINDHGMEHALNRGAFYGCRDTDGALAGVALFGAATLFDARTDAALDSLARAARASGVRPRLIRGERAEVERFWHQYAGDQNISHWLKHELMLTRRSGDAATTVGEGVGDLRRATPADLALVVAVNASLIEEESDGHAATHKRDPEGFALRTLRRIEHGRVWLWTNDGRVIFKLDVIADTPEAVYLEGVYVSPAERGQGHGLRCMSQLARMLLSRADRICLSVGDTNRRARSFYRKLGYEFHSRLATVYLHGNDNASAPAS